MKINPKDLNVPNQYQMNLNEFLNNVMKIVILINQQLNPIWG